MELPEITTVECQYKILMIPAISPGIVDILSLIHGLTVLPDVCSVEICLCVHVTGVESAFCFCSYFSLTTCTDIKAFSALQCTCFVPCGNIA